MAGKQSRWIVVVLQCCSFAVACLAGGGLDDGWSIGVLQ